MSSPLDPGSFNNIRDAFLSNRKKLLDEKIAEIKQAVEKGNPQGVIMAFPMLLALTSCPAMLGTQEAIRQSQSKNRREEHRAHRCNLVLSCVKQSIRSQDVDGKLVVLKNNKLYIASHVPSAVSNSFQSDSSTSGGYPCSGYFLPYPDSAYEGLVSTISDKPPMLNWIYIDKNTLEVKYGVRDQAQQHITGPFDCTKQDRRLSLEGWEGFVAVEEFPGVWALYYDRNDDGLKDKLPMGTRVLEVELMRREKKEPKPKPDPDAPQTLDEKMRELKMQGTQEDDHKAFGLTHELPRAQIPNNQRTTLAEPVEITPEVQSPVQNASRILHRMVLDNGATGNSGSHETYDHSSGTETNDVSTILSVEESSQAENESMTAPSSSCDFVKVVRGGENEAVHETQVKNGYQSPYVEDEAYI